MMPFQKIIRLSWVEKRITIEATVLLLVIRIALKIIPFKDLYKWSASQTPEIDSHTTDQDIDKKNVIRAVNRASRFVPSDKMCLAQALVGQALLRKNGYAATLVIGVNRIGGDNLKAHAWVESEGTAIIGGPDQVIEQFTPLSDLDLFMA